jgi:hypothetical protein
VYALPAEGAREAPVISVAPPPRLRRDYQSRPESLPVTVGAQPVAFNHRLHAGLGARCVDCHASAAQGARASIPDAPQCMSCHRAVKGESAALAALRRFAEERKPIPWVRVYQVPDFVFFGHDKHVKAGVSCTDCHGPVAEREVLSREVSTSMDACMSCHVRRGASTDCSRCHELGQ